MRTEIRTGFIAAATLLLAACTQTQSAQGPVVTVYKSPSCECCGRWAQHMSSNGFVVKIESVNDLAPVRRELGVPDVAAAACHTAVVDGYVVQGHVPAADIRQLLSQRPKVKGIAALGMTAGSPGMEMGDRVDHYDVVAFTAEGTITPFAHH